MIHVDQRGPVNLLTIDRQERRIQRDTGNAELRPVFVERVQPSIAPLRPKLAIDVRGCQRRFGVGSQRREPLAPGSEDTRLHHMGAWLGHLLGLFGVGDVGHVSFFRAWGRARPRR